MYHLEATRCWALTKQALGPHSGWAHFPGMRLASLSLSMQCSGKHTCGGSISSVSWLLLAVIRLSGPGTDSAFLHCWPAPELTVRQTSVITKTCRNDVDDKLPHAGTRNREANKSPVSWQLRCCGSAKPPLFLTWHCLSETSGTGTAKRRSHCRRESATPATFLPQSHVCQIYHLSSLLYPC